MVKRQRIAYNKMNISLKIAALFTLMFIVSTNAIAQLEDGDYYFLNVGAKMYLGGANDKGTQASLIKYGQMLTIKKNDDGLYSIDTHMYSSESEHFLGTNLYMDAQRTYWKIEATEDGYYQLSCDDETLLSYDGLSTILQNNNPKERKYGLWKITSEKERKESIKANSDVTFLIKGATFSHKHGSAYNKSYWEIVDAGSESDVNLSTGTQSNNCASAYHTTFDVNQKIAGVPCGKYKLTGQGFYRQDGNRASYNPELYLQDNSSEFLPRSRNENNVTDAINSFELHGYQLDDIEASTYDGTLSIGARLEKTSSMWCCWDNLVLTYVGDLTLAGYKRAYNFSIENAEGIIDQMMNTKIKSQLTEMLEDKGKLENNLETYKAFVNGINSIIADANNSILIYNKVYSAYSKHLSLDGVGKNYFTEKAQNIFDAYNDGTITDGEKEVEELEAIYLEAVKAQITPGTDMTDAIVNPNIDGADGWICEKPNGGNGPLLNGSSFEYWAGPSIDEDDRSFDYYQTVTGLQNGTYTVSCEAFNSMNGTGDDLNSFAPSCGLYVISGGTRVRTVVNREGNTFQTYYSPEIKVVDGTLTFGVTNFNTMVARWFVADNFRLILIEPDPEYALAVGIEDIKDAETDSIVGIYSINGQKLSEMHEGINIIRYSSGKTEKKLIK